MTKRPKFHGKVNFTGPKAEKVNRVMAVLADRAELEDPQNNRALNPAGGPQSVNELGRQIRLSAKTKEEMRQKEFDTVAELKVLSRYQNIFTLLKDQVALRNFSLGTSSEAYPLTQPAQVPKMHVAAD